MPRLVRGRDLESASGEDRRILCYEEGNVILDLHDGELYAIHSDIMKDTSDFFGPSSPKWTESAETVTHPKTGAKVKVLKYSLTYDKTDRVIVLDTGVSLPRNILQRAALTVCKASNLPDPGYDGNGIAYAVCPFYLSSNASGFAARKEDNGMTLGIGFALPESQNEHRTLFALLYKLNFDLQDLSYHNIANIAASAELYGLFELIAPALREHLLARPDIWRDVCDNTCFHLALSKKLLCEEIYADAMRHFLGQKLDFKLLRGMDHEADFIIDLMGKRDELEKSISKLDADLKALTLTTYIPHADHEHPGLPVKTSYLASSFDFDQIKLSFNIAHRIVMEWMVQQVSGTPHWSHVREYGNYDGAVFVRGSLREVCNLATRAVQTGTELELFDPNAAKRLVNQAEMIGRDTKPHAVHFVEEEIKKLVSQIANLALPYIAPPTFKSAVSCSDVDRDHESNPEGCYWRENRPHRGSPAVGRRCSCGTMHKAGRVNMGRYAPKFERVGMTANDEIGCHYFTCVDFEYDDMPWSRDDDFDSYELEGVEDASNEWLQAIGLMEKEETHEGEEGGDEA